MMKQAFPSIVETDFTANMEGLLDKVEEGTVNWKTVVENFYPDLESAVEAAEKDQMCIRDSSYYEPIGTDKEGNEIHLLDIMESSERDAFSQIRCV